MSGLGQCPARHQEPPLRPPEVGVIVAGRISIPFTCASVSNCSSCKLCAKIHHACNLLRRLECSIREYSIGVRGKVCGTNGNTAPAVKDHRSGYVLFMFTRFVVPAFSRTEE